jgi:hypothetical protein
VCSSCGVVIALLFSFFVIGFGSRQQLDQYQWDMSTVTVADYAVEFPIPPKAYADWYQNEYYKVDGDRDKGIPLALSLKHHLKREIEKFLTEDRLEKAGMTNVPKKKAHVLRRLNKIEEVKIADITFGYAN